MSLLRLYSRILSLLGPEKRLGWLLALGNLLLAVALFAEPILFGRIVDALAAPADAADRLSSVTMLLAAWVGFGVFAVAAGVILGLEADKLSHRRRQVVLTDYFEHVMQLPIAFHGSSHSGRLMKVMLAGTDALWILWLDFFREYFSVAILLIVLLPLSLFLNWPLALILMGLAVVFGIAMTVVVVKTETLQKSVERHYTDLAERASDALGNVALVQSFARVEAEVSDLRRVSDRLLAAQMPVLSWWAIVTVLTRASTTLALLAIFVAGIWLHFNDRASVGDIVTFMNLAGLVVLQLDRFVRFANRVFMEAPRLNEFFAVLDTEPAVRDRPESIEPGRLRGLVEFNAATFSYDGKRPAITDLSVTALPGETIALVGATGAGKSTALALLHRAIDPQAGTVAVDGMDVRGLKLAGLRRNIGVVFQEALLFNRSIADNLKVGKPDATEAELRDAAARAQALDFIEASPQGFDTPVGERGRLLSGGERQRLSIARALLKDPPILILDEATSALDAATEAKVKAALDEVMRERTTFVIAHRLSTVRNATRILVLDQGRVIEQGSFDELVAAGGRFAELAAAQFMAAGDTSPARQGHASDGTTRQSA
ncbi:glucan ABC transporter ATP-binding protein/ permease [Xanthobacteraceae bacterium Astr-EGSB]|uniref:glucan ABC transporter ATP-binding protein/ permease n=1 Tax=Astrobacterium formosum TaxID=3069710 RepID=UPI0027B74CAF|nr:glucan ABC transporter ATP-binding protein/ permease [Xanthobacteraceae bacterium Astr-EGSB]